MIRLIWIEFSKIIWNLDLKGALRNMRCNLHLFLGNIEPRTENQNWNLEKKWFENVVSDWAKNDLLCP